MTLLDAVTQGILPAYRVSSVTLFDKSGTFLGFYTDPHAFNETITIQ